MVRRIRSESGFSLVELMVVVAIIGILAAVAIPNFQRFSAKSKQSEAKSNLSAIYSANRAFQSEWTAYNSRFTVIGYQPTGMLVYAHGFTADVGAPGMGGYTGPAGVAGDISTTAYCGANVIGGTSLACGVVNNPVAPGALPAAVVNNAVNPQTFVASAIGFIGNTAVQDQWTINQNKQLTNVSGLP